MNPNASKLILGNALGQSWPIRAVIFLYYLDNGATPGQFQLAQWLMFWVLMFVEVPTGWLSDRWSRKGTLVAGSVCRLIGISCYALGNNVLWLIIGEQILGVAKGLHSGTVQAMLKESLQEEGKADEYRKTSAWLDITGNTFQVVAVFAGGIIGMYSLRATGVLSAIMAALALLVFLTVHDTRKPALSEKKERQTILGAFGEMFGSFRAVWINSTLRTVGLCIAVIIAASQHLYALRQPFAAEIGLPKEHFGLLETFAILIMIGSGWLARHAKPDHDRLWLVLMGGFLFSCMILAGTLPSYTTWLLVLLLGLTCIARGVGTFSRPITDDILQKEQIDSQRATVLSIASFMGYSLIATTGPIVQWLIESGHSTSITLAYVGIGSAVLYFGILLTSRWFWKPVELSVGS